MLHPLIVPKSYSSALAYVIISFMESQTFFYKVLLIKSFVNMKEPSAKTDDSFITN